MDHQMGFVQRQLRDLEQRKQSISEKRLRLEMEQLSECTFQPATNSNAEGPDGDGDPLHALYRDAGEMTRAKRLEGEHALSVQREMHELSLCTFVPQINEGRKRGRGATGEGSVTIGILGVEDANILCEVEIRLWVGLLWLKIIRII